MELLLPLLSAMVMTNSNRLLMHCALVKDESVNGRNWEEGSSTFTNLRPVVGVPVGWLITLDKALKASEEDCFEAGAMSCIGAQISWCVLASSYATIARWIEKPFWSDACRSLAILSGSCMVILEASVRVRLQRLKVNYEAVNTVLGLHLKLAAACFYQATFCAQTQDIIHLEDYDPFEIGVRSTNLDESICGRV